VVNGPGGTGSKSRLKGFLVAGKTGTSQVIELGKEKGMSKELAAEFEDHAWFVRSALRRSLRWLWLFSWHIAKASGTGAAAAPVPDAFEYLSEQPQPAQASPQGRSPRPGVILKLRGKLLAHALFFSQFYNL